jgi:hypothetical protein
MFGMLYLLGTFFANLFKPQRRLEIENRRNRSHSRGIRH